MNNYFDLIYNNNEKFIDDILYIINTAYIKSNTAYGENLSATLLDKEINDLLNSKNTQLANHIKDIKISFAFFGKDKDRKIDIFVMDDKNISFEFEINHGKLAELNKIYFSDNEKKFYEAFIFENDLEIKFYSIESGSKYGEINFAYSNIGTFKVNITDNSYQEKKEHLGFLKALKYLVDNKIIPSKNMVEYVFEDRNLKEELKEILLLEKDLNINKPENIDLNLSNIKNNYSIKKNNNLELK